MNRVEGYRSGNLVKSPNSPERTSKGMVIAALALVGAVGLASYALNRGANAAPSDHELELCAEDKLILADSNGVDTLTLSDGAVATFVQECDTDSATDAPRQSFEHYLEIAASVDRP